MFGWAGYEQRDFVNSVNYPCNYLCDCVVSSAVRVFTPRVNRHVTYRTAAGKSKPATIVVVTNSTTLNLRIGRHTTLVGILKESADNQVNVWRVAKAF